jgi:putative membrane protein
MMDWDGSWGIGGWLAMGLMMVAIWGVPIALLVWLVTRNLGSGQSQGTAPPLADAEATLAERFARGEIDEDEFSRRSELLQARPRGR